MKSITFLFIFFFLTACESIYLFEMDSEDEKKVTAKHEIRLVPTLEVTKMVPPKPEPKLDTIKVSVAGDFTIGSDESFGYANTFPHEADKNGLEYFVKNIKDIFAKDDFTSVNLETTLTTSNQKANKTFRFKGDPSYTEILTLGSIEAVNLANNHTYDYLKKGYNDTVKNLEKYNIGYFGNTMKYQTTIKDIKVGALGYNGWNDTTEIRAQIKDDIDSLRKQGVGIIITHFHWGEERQYIPNTTQRSLGQYAIDAGADLVVGHHPHVVQGIEEYKDKFIVYSLGNFMFGGNRNPSDKDTFVFQQTFHLIDGVVTPEKEINIIPFSVSSVANRNNYQPKALDGNEAKRVYNKILQLSEKISNPKWIAYEQVN